MTDDRFESPEAHRFTFLLDGLGDPPVAQAITRDLHEKLGVRATSDPAAMTLEIESPDPITESTADEVIRIAQRYGLEPRDRVGTSFVTTIKVDQLRERVAHEWASRFATGLVFLLPALGLHYLMPYLAIDTVIIPRGILAVLVGWSIIAAAWPVVYQALLSTPSRRMTPDLFAALLIIPTFIAGLWQMFTGAESTVFHVTAYALIAVSFQRLIVWRRRARVAGQAHVMAPSAWPLTILAIAAGAALWFDAHRAMAVLLATPAMIGALSITRLPGMSGPFVYVPVFGIAIAMLAVPGATSAPADGRIEAAFLLNIALTALLGLTPPRRTG